MENINNIPDEITIIAKNRKKTKPTSKLTNRGVLIVVSSICFGKSFVIDREKTLIGRSDECDINIDDQLISKHHCNIIFDEKEKFSIADLSSTNSTYVNDKAIKKKTHLIFGDRIILGNTILRFYLEEKI